MNKWTLNDFLNENDTDGSEIGEGICAGMSAAWLRGIFLEGKRVTKKPDIDWAFDLQDKFEFQRPEDYAPIAGLDYVTSQEYASYEDALIDIWDEADSTVGYFIITHHPDKPNDFSHAVAFKWEDKYGYLMTPNKGLFRCVDSSELQTCFEEEEPIDEWYQYEPKVTVIMMK